MFNAQDVLNARQRKRLNEKFHSLILGYGLYDLWASTIIGDEEDLKIFLLTLASLNDLQEFLQEKIDNWILAKASLEKDDPNGHVIDKLLTVYDLFLGFTDRIGDK